VSRQQRYAVRDGRQGGRIVDWKPPAQPVAVGETRILDLGDYGTNLEVTIVDNTLSGRRVLIRLPAGATLIVPTHLLTRKT